MSDTLIQLDVSILINYKSVKLYEVTYPETLCLNYWFSLVKHDLADHTIVLLLFLFDLRSAFVEGHENILAEPFSQFNRGRLLDRDIVFKVAFTNTCFLVDLEVLDPSALLRLDVFSAMILVAQPKHR